jgi:hypothetical protein
MEFFARPLLLSLVSFDIRVEPLKIQFCPQVCICFEFGSQFF